MAAPVALEMRSIVKEFPGVRALDGVSFSARAGEVHALCGENGAGKSTLMKVLSGFHPHGSYAGEIRIGGEARSFADTRASEAAGVAIIYQELSLVPEMSIAENVFLGHEPRRLGVVRRAEQAARARELLAQVGLTIPVERLVRELSVGQQQLVEIAKALAKSPKILILDEPTSALAGDEIEKLLGVIRLLKARGVACVLISHKLDEVEAVSDQVTVLRDGKSVSTRPIAESSATRIIAEMVGRDVQTLFPPKDGVPGEVLLEAKGLTLRHPTLAGRNLLENVSFQVRAGEILGVAGLMGSGRSELLMALFGAYPAGARAERVTIGGREGLPASPADAVARGMAFVTEDRKRLGLHLEQPIFQNMSLSSLARISRAGIVSRPAERAQAEEYRGKLRVKCASVATPVGQLSGGNQQKVVIAKALLTRPRLLLLDEPTRGIDIGAKQEIYALIRELAREGLAIVMVSSELPEILGLSDRVAVVAHGGISASFGRGEATAEKIMAAAVLEREGMKA